MFVMGVNHEKYDSKTQDVVSNASCTVGVPPDGACWVLLLAECCRAASHASLGVPTRNAAARGSFLQLRCCDMAFAAAPQTPRDSSAVLQTNCLAPLAKVVDDAFGIKEGLMTTVSGCSCGASQQRSMLHELRR